MIDLKSNPVFIPTIKYNTSPTALEKVETIYVVTLEFDGYSATTPIYLEPQDKTISLILLMDMQIIKVVIIIYIIMSFSLQW